MQTVTIVGAGYVGLSLACLLAKNSDVTLVDVVAEKVELINDRKSPIKDKDICSALESGNLKLRATTDHESAYTNAKVAIVAVPTNYDEATHAFDTSHVDDVLRNITSVNSNVLIVIKSTIPVGYSERVSKDYPGIKIIFSPEFLREGFALYDNLYPSRIIVGVPANSAATDQEASEFANLLASASLTPNPPVLIMSSTEAEAVKLFANTYLATRVAFFNELDIYAETKGLDTASLIRGVTLDPRIGDTYCNPSFGYGGYCLPKDTKQLLAEFKNIPQSLISAVVMANDTRKRFIANRVVSLLEEHGSTNRTVGAYRLVMKKDSDNFRSAAIHDVMEILRNEGIKVLVFEPALAESSFGEYEVVKDLDCFIESCDIIIANRLEAPLNDIASKVYSRDCLLGYRDWGLENSNESN